jgi:hypothetical protein
MRRTRRWDPEETLAPYGALTELINQYKPHGKQVPIVDGEHGFYTSCGSEAHAEDGWPWPYATSQSASKPMCGGGGGVKRDLRSIGVPSQAMQAVYLARALLVNRLAAIPLTLWYDWRDPVDATDPSGAAVFGLIHCLANDTSAGRYT